MSLLRLGLIGCGFIGEKIHLPVALRCPGVSVTAVVDADARRAEQLAASHGIPVAATTYKDVIGLIDAAIVAVPNRFHGAIASDLLRHGIHVLVEKPMACSTEECQAMVQAAAESRALLAVGMVRRFYDSSKLVKDLLSSGLLGHILGFDYQERAPLPAGVSAAYVSREQAGGGILMDIGVHVLDLLLWWLGDWDRVDYWDNAKGGVESDCRLALTLKSGVTGHIELSRTRPLPNLCQISGTAATLDIETSPYKPVVRVRFHREGVQWQGVPTRETEPDRRFHDLYQRQLEDFVAAIALQQSPLVPGSDGLAGIALIEACYRSRRRYEQRWLGWRPSVQIGSEARVDEVGAELVGRKALVTGGTGFIGGRLIEALVHRGVEVRALVRDVRRASWIARVPVEFVRGDVCDAAAVDEAVAGCDLVFHCAYGNTGTGEERRRTNIDGTAHILQAAVRRRVPRLVHLSTLVVYRLPAEGDLDETMPRGPCGNPYADSKLAAERLVQRYIDDNQLAAVIIQPTAVYGPWAPVWTMNVLEQLRAGRVILVDGGVGCPNPVYIDDVVAALLLAAVRKEAVGEAFLIAGTEPATWREFYGHYEHMLGGSATVTMSRAEAHAYFRASRKAPRLLSTALRPLREDVQLRRRLRETAELDALAGVARSLMPQRWRDEIKRRVKGGRGDRSGRASSGNTSRPIWPLDPFAVHLFSSKTRVRIDKAQRLLGYQPAVDLKEGMELTAEWARWNGLLPLMPRCASPASDLMREVDRLTASLN